eukprot:scaffold232226_cov22-Tisochrysis_lutea.AAC.2
MDSSCRHLCPPLLTRHHGSSALRLARSAALNPPLEVGSGRRSGRARLGRPLSCRRGGAAC